MRVDRQRSVDTLSLAGEIVSAYVANNSLTMSELPQLIGCVHAALNGLVAEAAGDLPVQNKEKQTPAQIRKSITATELISFIDGKAYKTLKRHLTSHGLDPQSYRERFGLPANYPMVAPVYAEQRSQIARAIGLGKPISAGGIRTPSRSEDRTNRRDRRKSADR